MNSVRSPFAILAIITLLPVAVTTYGQSFSLYSASNMIPTNGAMLNENEAAINPVLPIIEMTNIPLSQGILKLLRQSQMNASINWELVDWWAMTDVDGHHIQEPMLNIRWTNMTASEALLRVLREHHFTVEVEPVSLRSQITYTNDFIGSKDVGFFQGGTNNLIEFRQVPITAVLQNLARAAHLNYMLDPDIQHGVADWDGGIIREPQITLRLTNVTSDQVFRAICLTHKLDVISDPQTDVTLVRYPGHDVNFVEADIYANDTNTIPAIEFKDVPLSMALKNLARQARLKCILSPRIDTPSQYYEPAISLRWKNITAAQALAAVCENYDLNVIKYPVSGFIRVEPND